MPQAEPAARGASVPTCPATTIPTPANPTTSPAQTGGRTRSRRSHAANSAMKIGLRNDNASASASGSTDRPWKKQSAVTTTSTARSPLVRQVSAEGQPGRKPRAPPP